MKRDNFDRNPEIDAFLAKNPTFDKDIEIGREKRIKKEISEKRKKGVNSPVTPKNKNIVYDSMPKLDLHGKYEWQAEEAFRDFIGKHVSNSSKVLVVHGKGVNSKCLLGPVLKNMVERLVKIEFKNYIERWYHPEDRFGGEGATVIEFKNG